MYKGYCTALAAGRKTLILSPSHRTYIATAMAFVLRYGVEYDRIRFPTSAHRADSSALL